MFTAKVFYQSLSKVFPICSSLQGKPHMSIYWYSAMVLLHSDFELSAERGMHCTSSQQMTRMFNEKYFNWIVEYHLWIALIPSSFPFKQIGVQADKLTPSGMASGKLKYPHESKTT